jgi:photosystem II stability/assembly factor-like uncharacterized protein
MTMAQYTCLALSFLLLAACSSKSTEPDFQAVWPDALFDTATGEGGSDQAPAPDVVQPDGPDVDLPDASPLPGTWAAAQSPVGSSIDLHAVVCAEGQVFIAGDSGNMLHRPAGAAEGKGFVKQTVPTQADLFTVTFADLSYGVTAGMSSTIWHTLDGGTTWEVAGQCGVTVFDIFYALHLHSNTAGFAAGVAADNAGAAYKRYNNASFPDYISWVCPDTTYPGEVFHDVFRIGAKGWIVGATAGKVYYSEDQGYNWNTTSSDTNQILRGLTFAGAQLGVAVGHQGTIVRSQDGAGQVWASVSSPVNADLWDVFFHNDQLGWAVGEGGTILHTSDGGGTWQQQGSGTGARLEGVCFTSATEGWAVGQQGTILYTTSGGS